MSLGNFTESATKLNGIFMHRKIERKNIIFFFIFQYIFEGLAHLAARILIMASNSLEIVDQASVQRMCRNAIALQTTLSSITATREVALDNARNFYEMLYSNPEVCLLSFFSNALLFLREIIQTFD